jgi:hypothetical protein
MRKYIVAIWPFSLLLIFCSWVSSASAHEAYVLPKEQFYAALKAPGFNVFTALNDPNNLSSFCFISLGVSIVIAGMLFIEYWHGKKISRFFEKGEKYGAPILRIALGISLIFSALTWNFLGPELSLASLGGTTLLRYALLMGGLLITFGIFTELGALLALGVYTLASIKYGWYLASYTNYLAEILALIFFGAKTFSLDKRFGLWRERLATLRLYESTLIRVGYGFALAFAAVTIKLLHPILTLTVIQTYHLTRFSWLFPHDPLLVVLGAGLAELAIGIFIILGFELRLTILISLFYITLSLLYFGEAIWPHLILYGISFYLLLTPQKLALDNLISKRRV